MNLRIAALLCVVALAGCDAFEHYGTADTERLLATAGFQMHSGQDLGELPPHKLIERVEGGRTVYLYAEPQNCRCVYVGDTDAYAEYRRLEGEEIASSMTWDDF
jgi:hypothetical protein